VDDRPDYDYADGVTLRVYDLADGARVTTVVPTTTGEVAATFTSVRRGNTVEVTAEGAANWRVLLVGVRSVNAVKGGSVAAHDHGTIFTAGGNALVITLEDE
jgi:alpha-D-xyloside xylohydrolase